MKVQRRRMSILAVLSLVSGSALLTTGLSMPAMATAAFPETDDMYVIGCGEAVQDPDTLDWGNFYNDKTTPLNTMQLFSVDPTTGEATPIGDGTGSNEVFSASYSISCSSEPAWNPVTNVAYFKAFIYDLALDDGYDALMTMDLTTGDATEVAEFTGFDTAPDDCGSSYQGMAISDEGDAYVFDSSSCLYSLDLSTAAMSYIGGVANSLAGRYYAQAWSLDPVTWTWNVLENEDEFLSTVDVTVGDLSATGPAVVFDEDYDPQSLEFDSRGQGWALNEDFDPGTSLSSSNLYSLDSVSGAVTKVSDIFTVADGSFNTSSLLITRPASPRLPNTGADASAIGLIALSGAGLVIGGFVLLAYRRRA